MNILSNTKFLNNKIIMDTPIITSPVSNIVSSPTNNNIIVNNKNLSCKSCNSSFYLVFPKCNYYTLNNEKICMVCNEKNIYCNCISNKLIILTCLDTLCENFGIHNFVCKDCKKIYVLDNSNIQKTCNDCKIPKCRNCKIKLDDENTKYIDIYKKSNRIIEIIEKEKIDTNNLCFNCFDNQYSNLFKVNLNTITLKFESDNIFSIDHFGKKYSLLDCLIKFENKRDIENNKVDDEETVCDENNNKRLKIDPMICTFCKDKIYRKNNNIYHFCIKNNCITSYYDNNNPNLIFKSDNTGFYLYKYKDKYGRWIKNNKKNIKLDYNPYN